MTTETKLEHLSSANRKRDKHPARSARILTTGFSIAAVLGITSGYSLAEANKLLTVDANPDVNSSNLFVPKLQGIVAPAAAVAPVSLASALVPVTSTSALELPPVAVVPQPQVTAVPQVAPKVSRQKIQVQVSTVSSGSK